MSSANAPKPPASFYDALAEGYDAMTDFASRTARAERFVTDLLGRCSPPAEKAADVGCGTGAYTLALARVGVQAAGLDPSPEMIHRARGNASRLEQTNVRFVQAGLADVETVADHPLDVVVCMGNTLPHVLTDDDLRAGLAAAHRSLRGGGILALQLLNYDRILASRERIVSIDTQAGESFVRFYDFLPDGLVSFNLLRFPQAGGSHRLSSVLLRPYGQAELATFMTEAGFGAIASFGSLSFAAFESAHSETLLLVAEA
jgi:glycine/sarcosine N-methyltransferase